MDEGVRTVFVIGVGRSGTTAMAELLNRHEDICIGIERYKFKFLRRSDFEGNEFTPGRFFDFRAGDTNILPELADKWRDIYDRMRDKFPAARIRGDKIPHLFEKFDACSRAFPQAKWIYMLRDIDGVAASWNRRARNAQDKWPARNDFRVAVGVWNEANALIAAQPDDRVRIIGYEAFFGGSRPAFRRLLDFLETDNTRAFGRHARLTYEKYGRLQAKIPVVLEGQPEHLAATADMDTYRALLARAG